MSLHSAPPIRVVGRFQQIDGPACSIRHEVVKRTHDALVATSHTAAAAGNVGADCMAVGG